MATQAMLDPFEVPRKEDNGGSRQAFAKIHMLAVYLWWPMATGHAWKLA